MQSNFTPCSLSVHCHCNFFILDGRARPIISKIHYAVFTISCSHWIYPRWHCGRDATEQRWALPLAIQFTQATFSFASRRSPLGIPSSSFRNRLREIGRAHV